MWAYARLSWRYFSPTRSAYRHSLKGGDFEADIEQDRIAAFTLYKLRKTKSLVELEILGAGPRTLRELDKQSSKHGLP